MAILNSEGEIATFLKVSKQTVAKYIKYYGLPVKRMGKSKNAPVITTTIAVEKWIEDHLNIVDLPSR